MTDDIKCPVCGSKTILRTAKKGPNAGKKFYVCNRYPACKGRIQNNSSKLCIGTREIQLLPRNMIKRGYAPVTGLEFNIMATSEALDKMNFPKAEIEKLRNGLEVRRKVLKSSYYKHNIKFFLHGIEEKKGACFPVRCDICREAFGIGVAKLTSPKQCEKLPTGWMLDKLGNEDYAVVPPGAVIDYAGGKVYVVCGTCQLRLVLIQTDNGLLMHRIENGHGYVDLDKIEELIQ